MPEDLTEGSHRRRRRRSHRDESSGNFFKDNGLAVGFVAVVVLIVLALSASGDRSLGRFFGKLFGKRPQLRIEIALNEKELPFLILQNAGPGKLFSVKTLVHSFTFPANENDPANYLGPDPAWRRLSFATNEFNPGVRAELPLVGLIDERVVYVVQSVYMRERETEAIGQEDVFLWRRGKRQTLNQTQFKDDPDYVDMMRSIKSHWGRIPEAGSIKP